MSRALANFLKAEARARESKFSRWLKQPAMHIKGFFLSYVWYKLTGRRIDVNAVLFTGDVITVPIPAGLEFYLSGLKVHDSELRLTRYLISRVNEGESVVDVGAHIGYYSLVLAQLVGSSGRVVAFEPGKAIFPYLHRNTKDKPQIEIVEMMVSDTEGERVFYEFDFKHSENNTAVEHAHDTQFAQRRSVQCTTLDEFCHATQLKPKILKIDVEGGELGVLRGSTNLFSELYSIALEIRKDDYDQLYTEAIKFLSDHGFVPYRIDINGKLEILHDVRAYISGLMLESDNIVFERVSNE